jgi:hypothetical protein
MVGRSQYDIKELNKGARFNNYKHWWDPALRADKKAIDRILRQLSLKNGIWQPPLTTAERVAIASQAQVKHTWASVTKEYPDFKVAMKEYLDNRTNKPDLKKINKLKISPEKKFNMMNGTQKQFILRFNKNLFQPFKNSIGVDEMGELSKFKSIKDLVNVDVTRPYNMKNGVIQFDQHFYQLNRAQRFQDYLKNEGVERLTIPAQGSEGTKFKGRWILTDKAIKEGKTFASIVGAYPNLSGEPSTAYEAVLKRVTNTHPIYKDTQKGLRSLFNFVKGSINSEMQALKPSALRELIANNPNLLKQVTGRIEQSTGKIISSGVKGLNQLSPGEILTRASLITEHNRPLSDYATTFMNKDRTKVLLKNLRNIDADMAHNISIAPEWYNNSLKKVAANVALANQNNPEIIRNLSNEFKNMGQRFYVGDKFYGAEVATTPEYRTSIIDYWRNNLKGMGYDWDKYASKFNKRGISLDNILNKSLKDSTALRQLGTFLGCPGTFKQFDEGGRVRLQTGGQGLAQCVDTKLKKPGAMEKLAALPEEVSGTLGKLKNATRGFLSMLGRGGLKALPFAGLAAAGAAIEPLVKYFRNDDPSTYLTDESQMKGMLLATIEGETPKVDEELLKWQLPGTVAGAASAVPGSAALMKARRRPFTRQVWERNIPYGKGETASTMDRLVSTKTRAGMGIPRAGLGSLMKVLGGTFSPLAVAATLPVHIAAQRAGGTDYGDIATDPMNWMGPAFASTGAKLATQGMKGSPRLANAIRLGFSPRTLSMFTRRFGLPGLAVSAGLWGYDKWKNRSINDED